MFVNRDSFKKMAEEFERLIASATGHDSSIIEAESHFSKEIPMDSQEFQKLRLRTPQAADYLGLTASNMEKMRVRGDGPPYAKLGRLIIYDAADLDAWLSARKRTSTVEVSDIVR